jgi:hypothetical protein
MKKNSVAACLLDIDGSCRDINFEAPTWAGIKKLITLLEADFKSTTSSDTHGHELGKPFSENFSLPARNGEYARMCFNEGEGLITDIQVFVCTEENSVPFIELTFFPDDLRQSPTLEADFVAWAEELRLTLESQRYYVRYENASWQFGEISPHSGVFLVSDGVARYVEQLR